MMVSCSLTITNPGITLTMALARYYIWQIAEVNLVFLSLLGFLPALYVFPFCMSVFIMLVSFFRRST